MLASFAEIGLLIEIDVSSSRTNQTWTRDLSITNGIYLISFSNAGSYFLFYFTPSVRGIARAAVCDNKITINLLRHHSRKRTRT